jgi:hypothetical protein
VCDAVESCDGSNTCPVDAKKDTSTVCRPVAGICDVADHCDGTNNACTADVFVAGGTECRGDAGDCDVAEQCTGSAATCPADGFDPASTACGSNSDTVCDNPDTCNAFGSCQLNHEPNTVTCRSDAGECDVAELCDGAGACPGDSFEPSGTACGSNSDTACDNPDTCNSSGTCLINREPGGTPCRAAAGDCDLAEVCDGTDALCPANVFKALDTPCGSNSDTACDNPDKCNASGTCLPNYEPNTVTCRTANGACDVAESCDGAGACPSDALAPSGTVCRVQVAGGCDLGTETCTGTSNNCPADSFAPDYTPITTPDTNTCTNDYCVGGLASHPDNGSCTCTCAVGAPFQVNSFNNVGNWNANLTWHDNGDLGNTIVKAGTSSATPNATYVAITSLDNQTYDVAMSIKGPGHVSTMAGLSVLELVMTGANGSQGVVSVAVSTSTTIGDGSGHYEPVTGYFVGGGGFTGIANSKTIRIPLSAFLISDLSTAQQVALHFADPDASRSWRIDNIAVITPVQDCDYVSPDTGVCGCSTATTANDCDDHNPCTVDSCGGSAPDQACTHTPVANGTPCGDPGSGVCDNPDSCNAGVCAANHEPITTNCGDSGTECRNQDTCDGAGACADHGFKSSGTFCGSPGTQCVNQDLCDGAGACEDKGFKVDGTPCGDSSNSTCDHPDSCDGLGVCNPRYESAATTCRADAGDCDVAELCDGAGSCPANVFEPALTACGDHSSGVCDNADTCNALGVCLTNHEPGTTTCRSAAGQCDVAEQCDGLGACPVDDFKSSGSACGSSSDTVCDNPDTCNGTGTCLVNNEPGTTVCRADAGACDVEELCDGAGSCPANVFEPALTACGDPSDTVCSNPDSCDGLGVCNARNEASTVTCRGAAGECDLAEQCDGAGSCPADDFKSSGSACGSNSDTVCDNPDTCNGTGTCLVNNEPGTTTCRPDAGECDVAELCDGAGSCPANVFEPALTACGDPSDTHCSNPDS